MDFSWERREALDATAERVERQRLFDLLEGVTKELRLRDPSLPALRRILDVATLELKGASDVRG